jgi:hypothetical protein
VRERSRWIRAFAVGGIGLVRLRRRADGQYEGLVDTGWDRRIEVPGAGVGTCRMYKGKECRVAHMQKYRLLRLGVRHATSY